MPGEPVVSTIVFCDYVITDAQTGKNSLIGSFPSISSPQFPLPFQRFFVHTVIANFVPTGKPTNFAINLKHLQSGAVLASAASPVTVPLLKNQALAAPNGVTLNLNVPLQNVMFQVPGVYQVEVLLDGDLIGSRSLEVLQQIQSQGNPINPQ